MLQSLVAVAAEAAVSPQRQAVPEFETTAEGCRIATSGLQCLDRTGSRDRADHAPAAREPALGRDPGDDLVGHVLAQKQGDRAQRFLRVHELGTWVVSVCGPLVFLLV
jgi:hypothetical protein